MIVKNCPNCGKEFNTYPSVNKKTCGTQCAVELSKKRHWEANKRPCAVCGTEFVPKHNKSPGVFCSHACRGTDSRQDRVERHGYWYCRVDGHPRQNKAGYVPEHTLVMEAHIGRYLVGDEVVHHINHDRKDNRIENLQLMSDADHKRLHMLEAIQDGKVNRAEHRRKASLRMKNDNPAKFQSRGDDGRFISQL